MPLLEVKRLDNPYFRQNTDSLSFQASCSQFCEFSNELYVEVTTNGSIPEYKTVQPTKNQLFIHLEKHLSTSLALKFCQNLVSTGEKICSEIKIESTKSVENLERQNELNIEEITPNCTVSRSNPGYSPAEIIVSCKNTFSGGILPDLYPVLFNSYTISDGNEILIDSEFVTGQRVNYVRRELFDKNNSISLEICGLDNMQNMMRFTRCSSNRFVYELDTEPSDSPDTWLTTNSGMLHSDFKNHIKNGRLSSASSLFASAPNLFNFGYLQQILDKSKIFPEPEYVFGFLDSLIKSVLPTEHENKIRILEKRCWTEFENFNLSGSYSIIRFKIVKSWLIQYDKIISFLTENDVGTLDWSYVNDVKGIWFSDFEKDALLKRKFMVKHVMSKNSANSVFQHEVENGSVLVDNENSNHVQTGQHSQTSSLKSQLVFKVPENFISKNVVLLNTKKSILASIHPSSNQLKNITLKEQIFSEDSKTDNQIFLKLKKSCGTKDCDLQNIKIVRIRYDKSASLNEFLALKILESEVPVKVFHFSYSELKIPSFNLNAVDPEHQFTSDLSSGSGNGTGMFDLSEKQGLDMFYVGFLWSETDVDSTISVNASIEIKVEISKVSYGYKTSGKISNKNCVEELIGNHFTYTCSPDHNDWPIQASLELSQGVHFESKIHHEIQHNSTSEIQNSQPTGQPSKIKIFLTLWALCVLLLIKISRQLDAESPHTEKLAELKDNYPDDKFTYIVTTYTGIRRNSGTTSEVCIKIIGQESVLGKVNSSKVHHLTTDGDVDAKTFKTASVENFVLTTEKSVGELTAIRIWHDESGESPEWFLERVVVKDMQTGKLYSGGLKNVIFEYYKIKSRFFYNNKFIYLISLLTFSLSELFFKLFFKLSQRPSNFSSLDRSSNGPNRSNNNNR